ncbi:MAG: cytidine deaminase, partial [Lysobacterales bacterium 13-68-4]
DTPEPVSPCGACRQVMAELCDHAMPVLLGHLGDRVRHVTVAELLPYSFSLTPVHE